MESTTNKPYPIVAVSMLTVVHLRNSSTLKPSEGRYFNLQGAIEMGLEPNGEIGFGEPFSNWGFSLALLAYDAVVVSMERAVSIGPVYNHLLGLSDTLDDAIMKLEFCVRTLAREVRDGRCGDVEMYFRPVK